ncbi:MAG: cga, partial [Gemmatimonadetes bacterium]|nr:cga [Gemmatimonadota bacterium]
LGPGRGRPADCPRRRRVANLAHVTDNFAPGWPGIPARWTSSAKSGVGTAWSETSRVWFTLSHGILNEIYYPDVDTACTRDLGLIVTDRRGFFSEEKRHARHEVAWIEDGVPGFRLANACQSGRYRIEKTVIASVESNAVLQQTRFVPLQGNLADYHVHLLLSPHLGNQGGGNTAWVGEYKGVPMLFAQRGAHALALVADVPWVRRSVGFVGASDGWQDLTRHGRLEWSYTRAENGNVALAAEVDLAPTDGGCLVAVGFGRDPAKAAHHALTAVLTPFARSLEDFAGPWRTWQAELVGLPSSRPAAGPGALGRVSTAVLRTHQSKSFPGGMIASLSIPWGGARGDGDLGGYHLVWPRDLVETAGALLAVGARQEARRTLRYLQSTQEADGHWAQNQWLDGTPYWTGVQLDETAFPMLLVDLARREGVLDEADLASLWPMVRRAAGYLVRNGPVTEQDRWEEDAGYSPFTLAVVIAALLAAAELADQRGEPTVAGYLRDTADCWNGLIETWTYVSGTDLAAQCGVPGYYIRIAPPDTADAASPAHGFVPIKNRPSGETDQPAEQVLSPDALALVRFGLRAPDDPRILDTIVAIDATLRMDLPPGPAWRRYSKDGYGEHQDGSPFDGAGIGRPWPLLVGERAHYELAAGRPERARDLARAIERFASPGGLLPEQVWDGDGRVFDAPGHARDRYLRDQVTSPFHPWRFNHKCRKVQAGRTLRIELLSPAVVHWSADAWRTATDTSTRDTGLGVHLADLPVGDVSGGEIRFTFRWLDAGRWEGEDFRVAVIAPV